jgi:hypothetical protein
MGFDFGTVYVRGRTFCQVRDALVELMAETDRVVVHERGLEPTPDEVTTAKPVRSFALLPAEEDWIAVLEDGHSLDDGGIAEGVSDLLQTETVHFAYSDAESFWSYELYWEGQPLESGGAEDEDFDVSATEFAQSRSLPHFGVYYEEVAAAAGEAQPVLAGALGFFGAIVPRVPMGTEVLTFARPARAKAG